MSTRPGRLRFGVFLPPHHRLGLDPTLSLHRDLRLASVLDDLGYDELWVGEHHSSGIETIASPEVFIAAAAQRTTRIRLGTGVNSLPYHHPLILADRIVMLDHLTRGRMMFGAGPGQLLDDAQMLGIDPSTSRPRMAEALDVMLRLFRGERVTRTSDWFEMHDAGLQWRPYSDFDVVVTAAISPSGPKLAGQHGIGLLSLAATDPAGVEALAGHWAVAEEEAARSGTSVDRADWRLMGPIHLAESLEQAKRDVEYGLPLLFHFFGHLSPGALDSGHDTEALIDRLNSSGRGVIGTPDMAVAQLRRLQDKSRGFGAYLLQGSDFANWPATVRSYELFAEEVIPQLTGQLVGFEQSYQRVLESGTATAEATARAQQEARARYEAERTGRLAAPADRTPSATTGKAGVDTTRDLT